MTDEGLMLAWRGGDRAAASQLVERHFDAVVRFFQNKAPDVADDLVQRTFLAIAESNFRAEGSFRSFLFGVARNVLFEHYRGKAKNARMAPDFNESSVMDLAPGVSSAVAKRAELQLLSRALQRVPLELQVLLELYYWEDASIDELAAITGVAAGTVKSRLHRARGLLRDALATLPASEEQRRSVESILSAKDELA